MRARARWVSKLRLLRVICCTALLTACGNSGTDDPRTGQQHMATTSTAPAPAPTPTCWKIGPLPGSDPAKQEKTICKSFTAKPAPAGVVAKQAQYETAVKAKLAGDWNSLTVAERAAKARAFKDAFFSTTGGN